MYSIFNIEVVAFMQMIDNKETVLIGLIFMKHFCLYGIVDQIYISFHFLAEFDMKTVGKIRYLG